MTINFNLVLEFVLFKILTPRFFTENVSVPQIGHRSNWLLIIGIGPGKNISVDPYCYYKK